MTMRTFLDCRVAVVLSLAAACSLGAAAQAGVGSVRTEGVEVAGNVSVRDGRATIGANAAVTATAQPADVALNRGGTVRVCAGSSMHVSVSGIAVKRPPVMVALDRGSIEIHTTAEKTDAILTPDLRLELSDAAPLDLRIRVVPNGDTCVENAGKNAPMLHITSTFGDGAYFVRPGQRVLFEHGSVREVVDHESSNCGCPKAEGLVLAGKGAKGNGKIPEAARTNPFPEAVSQGLAAPEIPQANPNEVHTQVSSTLTYNGVTNTVSGPPSPTTTVADAAAGGSGNGSAAVAVAPANASAAPAAASAAPAGTNAHVEDATPPPSGPNPLRAIGRFFHKLFGGK